MAADGTVDSVLRSMSHASTFFCSSVIPHTKHQLAHIHQQSTHIYPHCFRVHIFFPCFSSHPASSARGTTVYSTGLHTLVYFCGSPNLDIPPTPPNVVFLYIFLSAPPFGFFVFTLDALFSNCYISCIMCTCSGRTIRLIFSCLSPCPFAFSTRLLLSLSPVESEALSCVNTLFGVVLLPWDQVHSFAFPDLPSRFDRPVALAFAWSALSLRSGSLHVVLL